MTRRLHPASALLALAVAALPPPAKPAKQTFTAKRKAEELRRRDRKKGR